jgi:hypothetical protein
MKADLTRNTLNVLKHYALVLTQQGRVSLDSDSNEQAAILLHYLQTLGADVIGPAGSSDPNAFLLSADNMPPGDFRIGLGRYYVNGIPCEAGAEVIQVSSTGNKSALEIFVPQWTLDGKAFAQDQLVEIFDDVAQPLADPKFKTVASITSIDQANAKLTLTPIPSTTIDITSGANPSLRRVLTYLTQPDLPDPDALVQTTGNNAAYLAYLDVWGRHITYIEDPSIREVALGGPDTSTRAKIVWQVKLAPGQIANGDNPCQGFKPTDPNLLLTLFGPNHGRLKARAQQTSASTDPCIIPPDANYRGEENQLYRVEVHTPGPASTVRPGSIVNAPKTKVGKIAAGGTTGGATFKWSRENGSVTFPIVGPVTTGNGVTTLTLANLGRDDRFGLHEGDWVEIQDDDYVLLNHAGILLQVASLDRTALQVTLTGTADTGVGNDQSKHPLLRRWDQKQGDPAEGGLSLAPDDHAAQILEDDGDMWLELEDGVQIQFQPAIGANPHRYRTGDYWLIPARTATADVEWPRETVTDSQGNLVTTPLSKIPDGIKHHYAPLGTFTVDSKRVLTFNSKNCFQTFKTLTQL